MGALVKSIPGIRYLKTPAKNAVADAASLTGVVAEILREVRARGDTAVQAYARAFDKVDLAAFEVTADEREAALAALDAQTRVDTEFAIERVRLFAEAQLAR
jgi:sulfopropanediol 3-dehydrogenase